MSYILGKKVEMSQIFEQNKVIPVTIIHAGPCLVLQRKSDEKDGYTSLQIGFEKKEKNLKKTDKGKEYRYIKENRMAGDLKKGDVIKIDAFKEGELVKISGVSKGKGFQGAVKRWGFHGRNATHGVKHEQRTLGSVGATGPARVLAGKKMAGRMGAGQTSVKNLKIVKIDAENNLMAVRGAVPGKRGTLVEIRN